MYYCTFCWLQCPWQSIFFFSASYTFFSLFFIPLTHSFLSFFFWSPLLVHVVPWPTPCQPPQLVSAPGNFSFQIKLHGISHLLSPFPCFFSSLLFLFWLLLKNYYCSRNAILKMVVFNFLKSTINSIDFYPNFIDEKFNLN